MVQRCSGTRRTTPGMKRGARISQLRSEQSATCGLSLWRWPRSRGRSSGAVPPLRDCAGRGVQVTARLRGVRGRGLAMPLVAAVAEFGADGPRSRAGGTHPASAPSSPGALASCVSRRPVSAFSRCRRRLHQPRDPALPRGPEPRAPGRPAARRSAVRAAVPQRPVVDRFQSRSALRAGPLSSAHDPRRPLAPCPRLGSLSQSARRRCVHAGLMPPASARGCPTGSRSTTAVPGVTRLAYPAKRLAAALERRCQPQPALTPPRCPARMSVSTALSSANSRASCSGPISPSGRLGSMPGATGAITCASTRAWTCPCPPVATS